MVATDYEEKRTAYYHWNHTRKDTVYSCRNYNLVNTVPFGHMAERRERRLADN